MPSFPAGVGQTELQVAAIADLRRRATSARRRFLKILLEKGRESGADLSSLRQALVSGEALPATPAGIPAKAGSGSSSATRPRSSASIAYESAGPAKA